MKIFVSYEKIAHEGLGFSYPQNLCSAVTMREIIQFIVLEPEIFMQRFFNSVHHLWNISLYENKIQISGTFQKTYGAYGDQLRSLMVYESLVF